MRSMLSQALGVELGPIVSLQEVSGTTADLSSSSASDITGARPCLPQQALHRGDMADRCAEPALY